MTDISYMERSVLKLKFSEIAKFRLFCFWLIMPVMMASSTGCSLFVMAGKTLMGDPVLKCDFRQATNINLIRQHKTVLVICDTPDTIKTDFPSLHLDLVDGISQKLKRQDIKIISPGKVASWLDDNGGYWNDPSELAEEFDTDIIIHLDLSHFDYREENSHNLLRGRVTANVLVYEVNKETEVKQTLQIFAREYVSEYPSFSPVSVDRKSENIFKEEYLDHVCSQISQLFYDHRSLDKLF